MDPWLKFFIVLAAVAIIGQMLILLGMFLQVKSMNERMTRIATDLHARIDPILSRLHMVVEEVGPQITGAAECTSSAHRRTLRSQRLLESREKMMQIFPFIFVFLCVLRFAVNYYFIC